MKSDVKIKNFAISIVFLSLALIFGYIENLIPINIGQVGVKIGLSNIITILSIKYLGILKTLIINALRLIILGILFGNLVRFTLSVSGFLLSFIVMVILLKMLSFKIIISSIFGAVFHNIGQILALSLILKNLKIMYLIPLYVVIGIVTGFIIGFITNIIYDKLNINDI